MKLMDGFDSNYRYILVAARRARQLQGGAPPVIETPSRKPCRIAQDEIKAGKVKWVIPEMPRSAAEVASEMLEKAIGEGRLNCRLQIFDFRFVRPRCEPRRVQSEIFNLESAIAVIYP